MRRKMRSPVFPPTAIPRWMLHPQSNQSQTSSTPNPKGAGLWPAWEKRQSVDCRSPGDRQFASLALHPAEALRASPPDSKRAGLSASLGESLLLSGGFSGGPTSWLCQDSLCNPDASRADLSSHARETAAGRRFSQATQHHRVARLL